MRNTSKMVEVKSNCEKQYLLQNIVKHLLRFSDMVYVHNFKGNSFKFNHITRRIYLELFKCQKQLLTFCLIWENGKKKQKTIEAWGGGVPSVFTKSISVS